MAQSGKDDEENIFSIQSSPRKTSAGHSMDLYQVGDNCPFCEEGKRERVEFSSFLFAVFLLKIDKLGLLIKEGKT